MNTDKYDELINKKQFLTETFDGLINHKMIKIEKNFEILQFPKRIVSN